MAELLNHSNDYTTYELLDVEKHVSERGDSDYFDRSRFMNDYSMCFGSPPQETFAKLNIEGRFDRSSFTKNRRTETQEWLHAQLMTHNVWDIQCTRERHFEDFKNDEYSDSEDEVEERLKFIWRNNMREELTIPQAISTNK
jgi:hypothetical protein